MEIKIIRKIDELGRVVIPIDVRKHLGLETADSLQILVENDCIILKKVNGDT
jgi:transcriptional pleiotropic regulator of transition state genes